MQRKPSTDTRLRRALAAAGIKASPRLRRWLERLLAGDAKEREEKNATGPRQCDSLVRP